MNGMTHTNWKKKFALYMVSQAISMLGSSIVSLALIWYVTLQTSSGMIIAGVTITTFIPQALVMLFGGVLADRYPPKRIVMLADAFIALSTLILAVLFWAGAGSIGWIFFFNTLRSLGSGLQLPASKSVLPLIVPQSELMKANSVNTSIWSIIQLVSPGLGGLAMNYFTMGSVLLIDVVSAAIGITIFGVVTLPARKNKPSFENTKEGLLQGFHYLWNSKPLRYGIILYSLFQFLVVPASQLTPLLATLNVSSEVWVLSVIETAFSVGALAVSLVMAYKTIRLPHFKLIRVSSALFGTTMLLLLTARQVPMFAFWMMLMGMGSPLYYTPLMTHIQENTEEAYMGRTFSAMDMFSSLAMPLGMVVFGPLASFNIALSFIIPGGLLILLGVLVAKKS